MEKFKYLDEADFAVTICDLTGIVVYMNNKSAATFAADGGFDLLGKSLLDCHPEPARTLLLDMLENPRPNIYTIEKNNIKKMIYQAPWLEDGKFKGLIELSLPLIGEIPHFLRH